MNISNDFTPASAELFFSKGDQTDPRLGELTSQKLMLQKNSVVVVGYPDDEGVSISRGRVGAAQGPDRVRKIFYKMTPSLKNKLLPVSDGGNLNIEGSLESRHQKAQSFAFNVLKNGAKLATLGGGHDYGFPDFAAFCEFAKSKNKRPFIVNFDAHLDVRPTTNGISSGTPFYRLLSQHKDVDFFEVGIQDWCNSLKHLKWVREKKGRVITLDEIQATQTSFTKFIYGKVFKHFKKSRHVLGLSVDVDAFSSSDAPGASQVFPTGLKVQDFVPFWQKVIKDFDPALCGFYETNPQFDFDDKTSRLVAILLHVFVHKS